MEVSDFYCHRTHQEILTYAELTPHNETLTRTNNGAVVNPWWEDTSGAITPTVVAEGANGVQHVVTTEPENPYITRFDTFTTND